LSKINLMKQKIIFLFMLLFTTLVNAQQPKENLPSDSIVIMKDYMPMLAESEKISDAPEGDTTSATPAPLAYPFNPKKAETSYETSTIKAVKIKDETLQKLYRTYVKLGLGNYSTYMGELYVGSLRSKKGLLGLDLRHFSSRPGLNDVGPDDFSKNHGGIDGKYFLENATFNGGMTYDRDVVHYYGYDSDSIILDADQIKQRFNRFGMHLGIGSNHLNKDRITYDANFSFSSLSDLYEVSENDFAIYGNAGKKVDDMKVNVGLSLDYFRKSNAKGELLTLRNNLGRNIGSLTPTLTFNRDKVKFILGLQAAIEKNGKAEAHLFPKIDIELPVAENILYLFAAADGGIIKNTYQTITLENPFVIASVVPENTINKIELRGGLKSNFSNTVSLMAMVKYSSMDNFQFFVNDTVEANKFNIRYNDGSVLNLHAELGYHRSEKFSAIIKIDQYSYKLDFDERPWHRPNTEITLNAKYNVWDKLLLNATIYGRGKYFARINMPTGFAEKSVKGYMDANLGIEYRYSKILSIYLNFNNFGFSKYNRWNGYPSEKLNVLGGLTYSF
jgi:hypothetical protein